MLCQYIYMLCVSLWLAGSPFKVGLQDEVNPQKGRCYGPGLDPKGVRTNQPATFTIDASDAGEAPLEATVTDPAGRWRC